MVSAKEAKTASLILTAIVLALSVAYPGGGGVGLYEGCSLTDRLAYSFLHANILHAAVNCWCLLTIVFIYDITLLLILASFVLAAMVPSILVPGLTVGMSAMCFILLGRTSWLVQRKLYYHTWFAAFIAFGFLFPNCAALLHLYCYVLGFIMGAIIHAYD